MRAAKSPAKLVDRPGGRQPGQQCRKIPHALTPAKFQRRNKSFLETVGSICVIAKQPVRSLPHSRPVFFDNYLPVNHLRAPSETLSYQQSLWPNLTLLSKLLSQSPILRRRYISRRLRLFYYNNSQYTIPGFKLNVRYREKFYIFFICSNFFLQRFSQCIKMAVFQWPKVEIRRLADRNFLKWRPE